MHEVQMITAAYLTVHRFTLNFLHFFPRKLKIFLPILAMCYSTIIIA